MRRILPALAAALLAASSALAQAPIEGKWWKRPRIAQALQLTAEQTAELEKIFARSKPKLIDLRAELEKKQFDYEQAMQSEDVDRKAVDATIESREQARAELQKELAAMQLDMKQVLKPEQRERLAEMRERARAAMQQRRRRMRDSAVGGGESDVPPAETDGRAVTPKHRGP